VINVTKRLYVEDTYGNSFSTRVEKIDGNNVWLKETLFYPESGGQAGDTGSLNNLKVIDTQLDSDKNICHVLESVQNLKVGDEVEGQIDWNRRYKIMRIHSASHIMEHFLFEVFGNLKLLGSHLNEKHDKSTYESDSKLDQDKLVEVEKRANQFIAKNLPIETWSDEKKSHFRYWKCGEIVMPCGGTHPKNTSEIGQIKLKRETGGNGREKVKTSLVDL